MAIESFFIRLGNSRYYPERQSLVDLNGHDISFRAQSLQVLHALAIPSGEGVVEDFDTFSRLIIDFVGEHQ